MLFTGQKQNSAVYRSLISATFLIYYKFQFTLVPKIFIRIYPDDFPGYSWPYANMSYFVMKEIQNSSDLCQCQRSMLSTLRQFQISPIFTGYCRLTKYKHNVSLALSSISMWLSSPTPLSNVSRDQRVDKENH